MTKVKGLVDEVSGASRQQTQGIEQVSQAIAQMEKVTQTTAATAEESAAASEELTAQAESAMDVVGRLETLVGARAAAAATGAKSGRRPRSARPRPRAPRMAGATGSTPAMARGRGAADGGHRAAARPVRQSCSRPSGPGADLQEGDISLTCVKHLFIGVGLFVIAASSSTGANHSTVQRSRRRHRRRLEMPDIVTDRPDFTESSEIVPKGGFQFESGVSYEGDAADGDFVRAASARPAR